MEDKFLDKEQFSWKKFFTGIFTKITFAKSIVNIVWIILIVLITSLLVCGVLYLRKSKPVPIVNTSTLGAGSTQIINNAPQQVRLTQGIYTRGSTDFDGVRGSVGVFKELTPHFEVELGGGVDRKDKQNNGFCEIGGRIKF
jgi:hypothetical protein